MADTAEKQEPLYAAEHVKVLFPIRKGLLVDRVVGHVARSERCELHLDEGETLGIVGESGAARRRSRVHWCA